MRSYLLPHRIYDGKATGLAVHKNFSLSRVLCLFRQLQAINGRADKFSQVVFCRLPDPWLSAMAWPLMIQRLLARQQVGVISEVTFS